MTGRVCRLGVLLFLPARVRALHSSAQMCLLSGDTVVVANLP